VVEALAGERDGAAHEQHERRGHAHPARPADAPRVSSCGLPARPTLALGTETDHVAPWRSAYKLHLLMDGELTFILTNGGHNAGVVSEPAHPGRNYRVSTRAVDGHYVDPDVWAAKAEQKHGSWWPEWVGWLSARSSAAAAPPTMGAADPRYAPIAEAPGTYVAIR
jgi:polyhydroxyalkanoate synthase